MSKIVEIKLGKTILVFGLTTIFHALIGSNRLIEINPALTMSILLCPLTIIIVVTVIYKRTATILVSLILLLALGLLKQI